MTKEEELEKEVTEYLNTQTLPKMDSIVYQVIKNLIFGFALPREKRIAELEAQIEKMKNCFNCAKSDWNNRVKCIKSGCVNKNKWEIKE